MSSRSKRKSKSSKRGKCHQSAPKKVEVDYSPPKAFIILLVALALVSFVLGCITRLYLISNFQLGKLGKNFTTSIITNSDNQGSEISLMTRIMPVKHLPTPKLASGRKAPISTYSSKIFHTANLAVASSNTVHLDVTLSSHLRTMSNKGASAAAIDEIYFNVDQSSNINMKPMTMKVEDFIPSINGNDETVHFPSGQHLVSGGSDAICLCNVCIVISHHLCPLVN